MCFWVAGRCSRPGPSLGTERASSARTALYISLAAAAACAFGSAGLARRSDRQLRFGSHWVPLPGSGPLFSPPKPARNLLRRRWPADTSIQSMRLFKRVHGFLLLAPACSRCTRLFRLRSSRCEIASTKIQLAPSSSDKSVMLFTLGVFPLRNRRKNSADRTEIPGKISWEKKISDYAGKLDSAHKVCIRSTVSIPRGLHAPRYP